MTQATKIPIMPFGVEPLPIQRFSCYKYPKKNAVGLPTISQEEKRATEKRATEAHNEGEPRGVSCWRTSSCVHEMILDKLPYGAR